MTTLLGIGGALLGGFLATALGFGDPIDEFFDLSHGWLQWQAFPRSCLCGTPTTTEAPHSQLRHARGHAAVSGMLPSLLVHRVDIERRNGVVVISAAGELDAFAAPDLSAAFSNDESARGLVVDLGSVSFLDSTALGVVVRELRGATEGGCNSRVVLPRGSARRIFEITTLDRVLPVAASLTEALAALTPAR